MLEANDALLEAVHGALAAGHFNSHDLDLLQRMIEALDDRRGMVRLGFVEAFGKIGVPAVPLLLEGLTHHPSPVVRRSCGKALAKTAVASAIPALVAALLGDEDIVVRSSAAGALARMDRAAIPALLQVLSEDHSPTAKGHVAWALGFMGTAAVEPLKTAFGTATSDARSAIVGAIAGLEPEPTHVTLIFAALNDCDASVRAGAVTALGRWQWREAVPKLLQMLSDESPEVRRMVAIALGKIGDPSALPELLGRLGQEEEGVRPVLRLAMGQIERSADA